MATQHQPLTLSAEEIDAIRRKVYGPFYDFIDKEIGVPVLKFQGYTQTMHFPAFLGRIRQLPVDESDVYVTSFPKSGTTWMQHIVWFLVTQKFDSEESIDWRFPELEIPPPYPPRPENLDEIAKMPTPRLYKTHFAFDHLPRDVLKGKVVYVYRNIKDTMVSYFHHVRAMTPSSFPGTFEDFVNLFVEDRFPFGPWHLHIKSYYNAAKQHPDHVMMISFEELKRDRLGAIRKIAKFIGRDVSEEVLQRVSDETSFEAMKKNEAGNYSWLVDFGLWDKNLQPFIRKGAVGDWKNFFTPAMEAKINDYMTKHMAGVDLEFVDN